MLTNHEIDVMDAAFGEIEAAALKDRRMMVHVNDKDGGVDIEFNSVWAAADYADEYGLRPVADLRDPRRLTDRCVLTFNLYDYALARRRAGSPVGGLKY